ncbi:Uncharacterised protein [uncultured archaeon]|nr:Uncharacterised protein [uncultured archaeon]
MTTKAEWKDIESILGCEVPTIVKERSVGYTGFAQKFFSGIPVTRKDFWKAVDGGMINIPDDAPWGKVKASAYESFTKKWHFTEDHYGYRHDQPKRIIVHKDGTTEHSINCLGCCSTNTETITKNCEEPECHFCKRA